MTIENQDCDIIMLHGLKEVTIKVKKLEDRLNKLEFECKSIRTVIDDLSDDLYDLHCNRFKIPHRCPACDAKGTDLKQEMCVPCDGKGIVWG